MNKVKFKIGVIGLGYVGLPLAAELSKKFHVIGFDINKERIKELNAGYDVTGELEKEELRSLENITLSNNDTLLTDCNVYIITVPTPIDSSKTPDLNPLRKASILVGNKLSKGDIVIYESTVYPGCTEEFCVPFLENISGLKFNQDFFCGYSPERINPGDKVHKISMIKKVVSGSTPDALKSIIEIYSSIISAGIHVAPSMKVAEAAKVIENSQRDLNIAFVNELSHIFKILNIDTHDVLDAAATKWNFLPFKPGLVGGHCISVDPYYLTYKAQQVGYNPQVLLSGRRINDNFASVIATNLVKELNKNSQNLSQMKIGVFGLTFKENCPDTRNSKVFEFIDELSDWGAKVYVFDPFVSSNDLPKNLSNNVNYIEDTNDLDVICLMVPHEQFMQKSAKDYKKYCTRNDSPVFFDLKSQYSKDDLCDEGFKLIRL